MSKRLIVLLPLLTLVTVLGTLGVGAAVVSADDGTTDAEVDGSASLRGAGFMDAEGDGICFVGGRGTVRLLSGRGLLWVKDLTGDATIRVAGFGEREEFADGWLQYAGSGRAEITGSRIIVGVAGVDIDLHARGVGRAMAWGHGTLRIITTSGEEDTADWSSGFLRWNKFGDGSSLDVVAAL
jgi:hypothetical protein